MGLTLRNGVIALDTSEVETLAISVVNGHTTQLKLPASQESGSALSFAAADVNEAKAIDGVASKLAEVQFEEIVKDSLGVGSECLYLAALMRRVNVAGDVDVAQTIFPFPEKVISCEVPAVFLSSTGAL